MSVVTPLPPRINSSVGAGPSSRMTASPTNGFDVISAYKRAIEDEQPRSLENNETAPDKTVPHPIAAILALVELMEASTASTVYGLIEEVRTGQKLLASSQPSLGVQAGCQLWERFISTSQSGEEFPEYKRSMIQQGRAFCAITAPQCREKIAALAVDFLVDDCTVLTHSYSRTVIQTILRAHKQHKRVKVYVTEARPGCLGLRTHQILTAAGVPCTVVLDSAVAYVMDRVDMVLVGSEAVVESGGLVSSVGTYQVALIAKAMQKPFYALAESYKFLRHYPLSQTDLPLRRKDFAPLSFTSTIPIRPVAPVTPRPGTPTAPATPGQLEREGHRRYVMTREMEELNPSVDVTTPDLIDFIFSDLGSPLSPTSVSQYIVAQFST